MALLLIDYQPGVMSCVRSVSMNGGKRSWREQSDKSVGSNTADCDACEFVRSHIGTDNRCRLSHRRCDERRSALHCAKCHDCGTGYPCPAKRVGEVDLYTQSTCRSTEPQPDVRGRRDSAVLLGSPCRQKVEHYTDRCLVHAARRNGCRLQRRSRRGAAARKGLALETPGVLRGRKSDRHVQLLPVNRVGPGCGAGQHSAARARTAEDPCRPSVGGGLVGACRPESRAGAVGRSQVHPPRHSTSQNVSVPRGHLRERFELDHATFFGAASGESGQWILSRLEWHADLRLGNHVQLFTQFQNAVAPGKARLKPVDQDRLDVEQAFIGLTEPLGGGTLRLRLGDRSLPSSSRDLRRFARARICVSPMTRRSRTTRAAGGTSSVPMSKRFRLRTYTRLTTTAITT